MLNEFVDHCATGFVSTTYTMCKTWLLEMRNLVDRAGSLRPLGSWGDSIAIVVRSWRLESLCVGGPNVAVLERGCAPQSWRGTFDLPAVRRIFCDK
jgi:hypothetical protein